MEVERSDLYASQRITTSVLLHAPSPKLVICYMALLMHDSAIISNSFSVGRVFIRCPQLNLEALSGVGAKVSFQLWRAWDGLKCAAVSYSTTELLQHWSC